MKVLTKGQADKEKINGLFRKGGTLMAERRKFCTGEYEKSIIGTDVPTLDGVSLVWAERRQNKEGIYYSLYCA